jgi:hypothetical protein
MYLNKIFFFETLKDIRYDTVYVEKPMSYLVDFNWKDILKPHPLNTDKETEKEIEIISLATKKRSKEDEELLLSIDKDIDKLFIDLLKQYNIDYPQKEITTLYNLVRPVLLNTKSYWNRPRPNQLAQFFNVDIEVIATDTHHTASYPSGHTAYARLVRNVIKKKHNNINLSKLDSIVNITAKARVMQGVHYPSDNSASIVFADFLFNRLYNKI